MQLWLQVAERWQEASLEVNAEHCGAPLLPLEKDELGHGVKVRKDNCKDQNPPRRRKVLSGLGMGKHMVFNVWLSGAALHGGKSVCERGHPGRKWRRNMKSRELHLC